jgi:hypothetical protein
MDATILFVEHRITYNSPPKNQYRTNCPEKSLQNINFFKCPHPYTEEHYISASHSLWRPGFTPGSVHVGFVVDKVALGQAFFTVLQFSPVNIIPPWLSILINHLRDEQ